jgi:hypothetical protein
MTWRQDPAKEWILVALMNLGPNSSRDSGNEFKERRNDYPCIKTWQSEMKQILNDMAADLKDEVLMKMSLHSMKSTSEIARNLAMQA